MVNVFFTLSGVAITNLFANSSSDENIYKSVRNIPDVKLINDKGTNVYDLIKFKNVLFTTSSIKNLEERYKNEKN